MRHVDNTLRHHPGGLGSANLILHSHVVVGCVFFVDARGQVDLEDELKQLRDIRDKKIYREMAVQRQTVERNMGTIRRAHEEFLAFTKEVAGHLDSDGLNTTPIAPEKWISWTNSLRRMILALEGHERYADFNETGMMRSLEALQDCQGLNFLGCGRDKDTDGDNR